MNTKLNTFLVVLLTLAFLLSSCASGMQVVEPAEVASKAQLAASERSASQPVSPEETIDQGAGEVLSEGQNAQAGSPEDSVDTFYAWYLSMFDESATTLAPVVSDAYQQSPYLTERLVREMSARAEFNQRLPIEDQFDLFLSEKQAPETISVETIQNDGTQALVVVQEIFADSREQSVTALVTKTSAGWKIDDLQAGNPSTPAGLAEFFFNEYSQPGQVMDPAALTGGFEIEGYMSADYRKQVAEIKAGFEGAGFDPVLHAQQYPYLPVSVQEVAEEGNQAQVEVDFHGWQQMAYLEQMEGQWQLVPDRVEGGALTPAETVQAFYDAYLSYIHGGPGGEFQNPLSSGAYRDFPYIGWNLFHEVDELAAEGGFPFDPFLCAQDVPESIEVVASYDNGSRPVVVAKSSFPGHYLVIDLIRDDFNRWALHHIQCSNQPETLAKAFYTWYLGYVTGGDEWRNPLVDGAYKESEFLSKQYIEELDNTLNSGEPLGFDPILFAQDIPSAFNTQPGELEGEAFVNMQFGSAFVHQVKVETVMEDGCLRIAGISAVEKPEFPQPEENISSIDRWVPFCDEQYGYVLGFPGDWLVEGLKVNDLHSPQDYPVMRSLSFRPQTGYENIPLIRLEIVESQDHPMQNIHPMAELVDELPVNGYQGELYQDNLGLLYAVFEHPSKPGVWLVLIDTISSFPGREDLADGIAPVFDGMLSTLRVAK